MVLYALVFLAGGICGAFLMSLLLSGKREDAMWSEASEKLEFHRDDRERIGSAHAMAAESD